MRINYLAGRVVIPGYRCGECDQANVKLWRYRGVMVSQQKLKCVVCASKLARIDYRAVNGLGLHRVSEYGFTQGTTHIGNMVPAVPSDVVSGKIENYWSYNALGGVARDGMNWWRALPLT